MVGKWGFEESGKNSFRFFSLPIGLNIMAFLLTFSMLQTGLIYETNPINAFFLNFGLIPTLAWMAIFWGIVLATYKFLIIPISNHTSPSIRFAFIGLMSLLFLYDFAINIKMFINLGGLA